MNLSYIQEVRNGRLDLARKCILPAIILLTALGIGISIIFLSLGYTIVFQNLLYFPIILTSIYYPKRGVLYTAGICAVYLALMIAIPQDPSLIPLALIRIVFFMLIAVVVVRLSRKKWAIDGLLIKQREELETMVAARTETIARELEQSRRLEKAYRDTADYHERCLDQMNVAVVQWNTEMYITKTNPAFEQMLGRVKNDLVGRKLSSIPFLEEASRNRSGIPVRTEFRSADNAPHTVQWVFSDIFTSDQSMQADIVGHGMEIGKTDYAT